MNKLTFTVILSLAAVSTLFGKSAYADTFNYQNDSACRAAMKGYAQTADNYLAQTDYKEVGWSYMSDFFYRFRSETGRSYCVQTNGNSGYVYSAPMDCNFLISTSSDQSPAWQNFIAPVLDNEVNTNLKSGHFDKSFGEINNVENSYWIVCGSLPTEKKLSYGCGDKVFDKANCHTELRYSYWPL